MKEKHRKSLLEYVKTDYSQNADEFDERRQTPWKEFEKYIKYIKNNDKIADIGCGNGRLLDFIKNKRKINYTGVDAVENLIQIAKKRYAGNFFVQDAFDTKLAKEEFDVVFSIATLHHIPSKKYREKTISEMHRITKKNGIFIISVWNLYRKKFTKYFIKSWIKWLISGFQNERKALFIPWGKNNVKRYFQAISTKELENKLLNANFEILEKYTNKNIIFICKKK